MLRVGNVTVLTETREEGGGDRKEAELSFGLDFNVPKKALENVWMRCSRALAQGYAVNFRVAVGPSSCLHQQNQSNSDNVLVYERTVHNETSVSLKVHINQTVFFSANYTVLVSFVSYYNQNNTVVEWADSLQEFIQTGKYMHSYLYISNFICMLA